MDFEYIYVRLDNDRKKINFGQKSTFKNSPLFMKTKVPAIFEVETWVNKSKLHIHPLRNSDRQQNLAI